MLIWGKAKDISFRVICPVTSLEFCYINKPDLISNLLANAKKCVYIPKDM